MAKYFFPSPHEIFFFYSFLTGDDPASLKDLCLKLLTIIATGVDNVSQNTLLEYVMMNSVYESLIHLLSNTG